MNKVILLGRLARDPEIRHTQSGKAVASMTIAVNRPKSRNAQEGQQTADFIPLVAWEKTAEFAEKYLQKGTQILVEGKMQVRKYTAQDGSDRWTTEVKVDNIEFAGSKPQQGETAQISTAYRSAMPPTPQDAFTGGVDTDEEIPF